MSLQTLPSCPQTPMLVSGTRLFLDICAGATRPLSQAALQAGMHVLSVDPLCACQLDLFNDLHYEQLLRLSFSGAVWFACASPPCGDFSTIKLRPGPGPRPIRTRGHPFGIPDASASQLVRLQKSLCLLERSVSILLAVFFPLIGGQRLLLLCCSLCFWHECSQTLDVCYIFCGPQCFGMRLQP